MASRKKRKKPHGSLGFSFDQALRVLNQTDEQGVKDQRVTANTLRTACDVGLIQSARKGDNNRSHRRITSEGLRVLRDLVSQRQFKSELKNFRERHRLSTLGQVKRPVEEVVEQLPESDSETADHLIENSEQEESDQKVSVTPPGTVYHVEEAAQHLRLDIDQVRRHIDAGDLTLYGELLHVQDLLQFIERFGGAFVVPILASPRFVDQILDTQLNTQDGFIQVGRLVNGVETIDALSDEYRHPAFPAQDEWYVIWP